MNTQNLPGRDWARGFMEGTVACGEAWGFSVRGLIFQRGRNFFKVQLCVLSYEILNVASS